MYLSMLDGGSYRPGRVEIKSFMGLPNKHIARDSPVCGSGIASVSRLPRGPVFDVIILCAVLTPIFALQFEWWKATKDRLGLIP